MLLTLDQGLPHQQHIAGLKLAIVTIHSSTSQMEDLLPLVNAILAALPSIKPGQIVQIREP